MLKNDFFAEKQVSFQKEKKISKNTGTAESELTQPWWVSDAQCIFKDNGKCALVSKQA